MKTLRIILSVILSAIVIGALLVGVCLVLGTPEPGTTLTSAILTKALGFLIFPLTYKFDKLGEKLISKIQ